MPGSALEGRVALVTGAAKRRGDSEYYRGVSRKGVAARKKKAKKKAKK